MATRGQRRTGSTRGARAAAIGAHQVCAEPRPDAGCVGGDGRLSNVVVKYRAGRACLASFTFADVRS